MNGCESCFRHRGPIDVVALPGTFGQCDFCEGHGVDVWNVTIWADHFARVLEMYEPSDRDDAAPLHEAFQRDWRVFSFEDSERIHSFLTATLGGVGGHQILAERLNVSPRFTAEGAEADHRSRWEEFRTALISQNRYFPQADLDLDYLRDLIRDNTRNLSPGMTLVRARAVPVGTRLESSQLGAPPAHLVSGGRGNPVGIPHLYLANDVRTALHECRAQYNGEVATASFQPTQATSYLDLAELEPANPFLVPDTGEGSALVQNLAASQILTELGHELSIPTRPGENQIEYVPTQYLCELVKSLGVRGIRYKSAMHPAGWNIVLFHPSDAQLVGDVTHYRVTDYTLDFTVIYDALTAGIS